MGTSTLPGERLRGLQNLFEDTGSSVTQHAQGKRGEAKETKLGDMDEGNIIQRRGEK